MATGVQKTEAQLKAYFETGDMPTEQEFADLIATMFLKSRDANLINQIHQKNKDTKLAEGTDDEVSAAELKALTGSIGKIFECDYSTEEELLADKTGFTLNGPSNGVLNVAGFSPQVGQTIFVKDNPNYENGVYDVVSKGSSSTKWRLSRRSGFIKNDEVHQRIIASKNNNQSSLFFMWLDIVDLDSAPENLIDSSFDTPLRIKDFFGNEDQSGDTTTLFTIRGDGSQLTLTENSGGNILKPGGTIEDDLGNGFSYNTFNGIITANRDITILVNTLMRVTSDTEDARFRFSYIRPGLGGDPDRIDSSVSVVGTKQDYIENNAIIRLKESQTFYMRMYCLDDDSINATLTVDLIGRCLSISEIPNGIATSGEAPVSGSESEETTIVNENGNPINTILFDKARIYKNCSGIIEVNLSGAASTQKNQLIEHVGSSLQLGEGIRKIGNGEYIGDDETINLIMLLKVDGESFVRAVVNPDFTPLDATGVTISGGAVDQQMAINFTKPTNESNSKYFFQVADDSGFNTNVSIIQEAYGTNTFTPDSNYLNKYIRGGVLPSVVVNGIGSLAMNIVWSTAKQIGAAGSETIIYASENFQFLTDGSRRVTGDNLISFEGGATWETLDVSGSSAQRGVSIQEPFIGSVGDKVAFKFDITANSYNFEALVRSGGTSNKTSYLDNGSYVFTLINANGTTQIPVTVKAGSTDDYISTNAFGGSTWWWLEGTIPINLLANDNYIEVSHNDRHWSAIDAIKLF